MSDKISHYFNLLSTSKGLSQLPFIEQDLTDCISQFAHQLYSSSSSSSSSSSYSSVLSTSVSTPKSSKTVNSNYPPNNSNISTQFQQACWLYQKAVEITQKQSKLLLYSYARFLIHCQQNLFEAIDILSSLLDTYSHHNRYHIVPVTSQDHSQYKQQRQEQQQHQRQHGKYHKQHLSSFIYPSWYYPAMECLDTAKNLVIDRWHFRMLNDDVRNLAYKRAIENAVRKSPNCTVLDIGGGTGILSIYAALAGATQVYYCEMSSELCTIAAKCIERSGVPVGVIQIINKHSKDITIHPDCDDDEKQKDINDMDVGANNSFNSCDTTKIYATQCFHKSSDKNIDKNKRNYNNHNNNIDYDLPHRVDIIVTELVDSGLLGEHILPTLQDANNRLLKKKKAMKQQTWSHIDGDNSSNDININGSNDGDSGGGSNQNNSSYSDDDNILNDDTNNDLNNDEGGVIIPYKARVFMTPIQSDAILFRKSLVVSDDENKIMCNNNNNIFDIESDSNQQLLSSSSSSTSFSAAYSETRLYNILSDQSSALEHSQAFPYPYRSCNDNNNTFDGFNSNNRNNSVSHSSSNTNVKSSHNNHQHHHYCHFQIDESYTCENLNSLFPYTELTHEPICLFDIYFNNIPETFVNNSSNSSTANTAITTNDSNNTDTNTSTSARKSEQSSNEVKSRHHRKPNEASFGNIIIHSDSSNNNNEDTVLDKFIINISPNQLRNSTITTTTATNTTVNTNSRIDAYAYWFELYLEPSPPQTPSSLSLSAIQLSQPRLNVSMNIEGKNNDIYNNIKNLHVSESTSFEISTKSASAFIVRLPSIDCCEYQLEDTATQNNSNATMLSTRPYRINNAWDQAILFNNTTANINSEHIISESQNKNDKDTEGKSFEVTIKLDSIHISSPSQHPITTYNNNVNSNSNNSTNGNNNTNNRSNNNNEDNNNSNSNNKSNNNSDINSKPAIHHIGEMDIARLNNRELLLMYLTVLQETVDTVKNTANSASNVIANNNNNNNINNNRNNNINIIEFSSNWQSVTLLWKALHFATTSSTTTSCHSNSYKNSVVNQSLKNAATAVTCTTATTTTTTTTSTTTTSKIKTLILSPSSESTQFFHTFQYNYNHFQPPSPLLQRNKRQSQASNSRSNVESVAKSNHDSCTKMNEMEYNNNADDNSSGDCNVDTNSNSVEVLTRSVIENFENIINYFGGTDGDDDDDDSDAVDDDADDDGNYNESDSHEDDNMDKTEDNINNKSTTSPPHYVYLCSDIIDSSGLIRSSILKEISFALQFISPPSLQSQSVGHLTSAESQSKPAIDTILISSSVLPSLSIISSSPKSIYNNVTVIPHALTVIVQAIECHSLLDHHRVRPERTFNAAVAEELNERLGVQYLRELDLNRIEDLRHLSATVEAVSFTLSSLADTTDPTQNIVPTTTVTTTHHSKGIPTTTLSTDKKMDISMNTSNIVVDDVQRITTAVDDNKVTSIIITSSGILHAIAIWYKVNVDECGTIQYETRQQLSRISTTVQMKNQEQTEGIMSSDAVDDKLFSIVSNKTTNPAIHSSTTTDNTNNTNNNNPARHHWRQAAYLLPTPRTVSSGDIIRIKVVVDISCGGVFIHMLH